MEFSGYYFYMKRNKKRDFQICVRVPLIPKEIGHNMTDVNNNSINGIVLGFSNSNDITSYSRSNTVLTFQQTKEISNP